jgi:hypothetical protein
MAFGDNLSFINTAPQTLANRPKTGTSNVLSGRALQNYANQNVGDAAANAVFANPVPKSKAPGARDVSGYAATPTLNLPTGFYDLPGVPKLDTSGGNLRWEPSVAPTPKPRDVSMYAPTPAFPVPEGFYDTPGVPELDTSGGGLRPAIPGALGGPVGPVGGAQPPRGGASVPQTQLGDAVSEVWEPPGNMFIRSMGTGRSPVEYSPQPANSGRAAPMAQAAQQAFFAPIGPR